MSRKTARKPPARPSGRSRNLAPGPSWLPHAYSTLAILGIVLPWYFNVQAFSGGMGLVDFFRGSFANPAASSVSADISVACAAFFVWLFVESRRTGVKRPWIYMALTLIVSLAFAFPLFLLARYRAMENRAPSGG